MSNSISNITSMNFTDEVMGSNKPVVIDFWATWCMPCKMLTPIIDEIAEEYSSKYKVCKLNIDDAMDIATKFGVMNIPTLVFVKDGQEQSRITGVVPKEKILEKLEEMS